MDPGDVLLTVSEISIAVVGFAAIVLAVRPTAFRAEGTLSALRLRVMIEGAAATLASSFLPALLFALQLRVATVWRVSSGLLAAATIGYAISIYVRQKRLFNAAILPETRLFDIGFGLVSAVVVGLLLLNCWTASPGPAAYLAGVLWGLTGAIVGFVRLVFFPEEHSR